MFEGLEENQLAGALEALLFVTDEPVDTVTLARMLEIEPTQAQAGLLELQHRLDEEGSGIILREVAGGWRLFTHPAFHDLIEKYVVSWDTRKLSQAALEALAVVAYGQPITRAQVSAVRGVNSDTALNTLIDRGYVQEAGTLDAPGNPLLYRTTRTFLEKFGLQSPKDLPDLAQFAPDEKTAALIVERLGGAPAQTEEITEEDLPDSEQLVADAQARLFGAVEKIDFDALTFNTDDD